MVPNDQKHSRTFVLTRIIACKLYSENHHQGRLHIYTPFAFSFLGCVGVPQRETALGMVWNTNTANTITINPSCLKTAACESLKIYVLTSYLRRSSYTIWISMWPFTKRPQAGITKESWEVAQYWTIVHFAIKAPNYIGTKVENHNQSHHRFNLWWPLWPFCVQSLSFLYLSPLGRIKKKHWST